MKNPELLLILISICFITNIYEQAPSYYGIDVSYHNGVIDWKTVSKNKIIQFVYIMATVL